VRYSAQGKQASTPSYKRHRFPSEIIAHAVWLCYRFALSYRDMEELRAALGVLVSYETIRQWCRTFGQASANELRRYLSWPVRASRGFSSPGRVAGGYRRSKATRGDPSLGDPDHDASLSA
jgi:hypothetical protein